MIIKNIKSLVQSYYFSQSISNLDNLRFEISRMNGIRPIEKLNNLSFYNDDYKRVLYLSNLNPKKIRRKISKSIEYEEVIKFNEELKLTSDLLWIQNFNDKEYWLLNILTDIKRKNFSFKSIIEKWCGYDETERARLDEDYRIIHPYKWSKIYPTYDTFEDNPYYTSKVNCHCKLDISQFNKGDVYTFRSKIGTDISIVYFYNHSYQIFEEGSISDYFMTRDDKIDIILN